MAVPKQKIPKGRRDRRRNATKLEPGTQSVCPQCGQVKLPHRVCGKCGFYNKKKVIDVGGKE